MAFNTDEKDKTFTQEEVNQIVADRLKREKNTLDAYKAELAAQEAARAARDALKGRMLACMGDRVFVHERLTDLVLDDFDAAMKNPANKGKSDKEVFDTITKDQGLLAPKNAPRFTGRSTPAPSDDLKAAFFGKKG